MKLEVNCKTLYQMLTQNLFSYEFEISDGVKIEISLPDINDINAFGNIDEKIRTQILYIASNHIILNTKSIRCYKDVFTNNDKERYRIYIKPIKLPKEVKKIK